MRVFKHDFFAVTALYDGPSGKAVLKIGRKADFWGFPCGWIGRFLTRHEAGVYLLLQDSDAIPRFLGLWGRHGLLHAYVEGHPMQAKERVPDDFFDRLRHHIDIIHRRGMAYVDLEKPQNVIVGDDGRPYLVDFQIAWHIPERYGGRWWPARFVLKLLQEADLYHLNKLQRRTRPDQLTPEQLAATHRKPWMINLHDWLTRPALLFRRRTLERFGSRRHVGERGAMSEHTHEDPG
ncbi:MAG: hypothetical protein V2A79_16575 [Planctomycetota bacterium]